MKKITSLLFILLAAGLLAAVNTGCSAKAKTARHLQKADGYFAAGDYDQAELEYVNALRTDHENARAISQLGTIYFNQGRMQKSVPFLFKSREQATNDLDLRLKIGSFFLVAGKPKEARDEAEFVLAHRPQDNQAPLLLVATAMTPKALEETRQRLLALVQKGDGAGLQVALGSLALRSRDNTTAEAAFKRAQTLDPKLSAPWSALGALYLVQSNLVQAEAALKTAAGLAADRSEEKMQYAQFKIQTGDAAAGRGLLQAMVQKTPDYIPAWMLLAQLSVAEKKYDEAATMLAKLLARDPDNFNALMASGQLKLTLGKTAEAMAEFERITKIYAQAPAAHYQLAVACVAGNETDKAIASLNKAVALNTNFSEAILLLDGLEIKRGNMDVAIGSLKQMVQQHPQSVQVQLLLADAYRARAGWDDALGIYRRLQGLYPTNAEVQSLMGVTFLQQKNFGEARTSLTRALALAPDNLMTLEQMVNLDLMEKQYADALQRVQASMAKNPGLGGLEIMQAQIFMAQGDAKQAEAALLKMVGAGQDTDTTHMLLARLYMEAKQNQKALAELKAATVKNPKNTDALLVSGMIYNEEQDYKAARDAYEKLLALDPKSSPGLNNLAYLYSEFLGDLDRAYELAQRVREQLPNDPSAADTLGWILCKRGQYTSAAVLLQESAGQLPGEPEAQFHLGWTLYMMGDEDAARPVLQRAVQPAKTFRGQQECNQCLDVLAVDAKSAGADAVALLEKRVSTQPTDVIAWIRLAAIYQRNGATDKAIMAYESALKINPKNVPALVSLAQLYAAKKNPQKAVELAKAAYKQAPDNPQISLILGRLAYETGDYKLSLSLLQEAARNEPRNPDVLFDFAKAAYAMGQVPQAETAARNALQTVPAFSGSAEAKKFLSMITALANPAAAQSSAQEILKSEPDYVPALMVTALLDDQKNDAAAAKQVYKKVLGEYPNFSPAQRNMAILCAGGSEMDPQAYEFATKARAMYPDDPALTKALGIILYQQADYPKAERILKESTDTMSGDAEIWYYLGMTQYHLKKPLDCKKSLRQSLTLNLPARFTTETMRVLTELK